MKTKRLVILSMLVALSVILHYVESLIPPFLPIVGFRLGLSNLITLFALFFYGGPSYIFVMLVKVLLVALISSGFSIQFFMSLTGSVLSMGIALFLYYVLRSSIYSNSIMASLFHTLGQLLMYAIFFNTFYIFSYLAILGPLSLLTGLFNAVLVKVLITRLPKSILSDERKRRSR